jgi:uncharacterized protein (TIGR00255 family)
MLRSMTGYGRATYEIDAREYVVEIKSVNNRYSDISIKMPRSISFLEDKIKKLISNAITRGKIEVFVSFTNNSDIGRNIEINREIAKRYIEEMRKLASEQNINSNIEVIDVMKMPDVLNTKIDETAEEVIKEELIICTNEAIKNFISMREVEGEKIKEDLEKRINVISEKINKINSISTGLVEEYIVKLEKRVNELLKPNVVDETRLAQEIVIYSDKCSVEEEITRMKSHISQFLSLLDKDNSNGKRIDFLIQEMNRETNTIGSKANNLEITNYVVDIKTELENIREQIQNIE